MIRGVLIEVGERELCDGSGAICAVVEISLEDARGLAPHLYHAVDIGLACPPAGCTDPSGPGGGCLLVE